uniref:VWFA domain-containing protein n=1 Tax=Panagrolaimus sp. ES5 TaxID=591445 RepID=A0AC34GFE7_9BILA
MFVSTFMPIPYDIPGQAQYWVNNYKSPNNTATAQDFINNAQKMAKCKPPGKDLIFIVDSSGSIGSHDFELARSFIVSIINNSREDSNNRVGIVRFSTSAVLISSLTYDMDNATEIVENMYYDAGSTNIQAGLDMANEMFMSDGRIEVPNVAILITDGKANEGGPPGPAADNLKSLGVNLFTIGVGSQATTDLLYW